MFTGSYDDLADLLSTAPWGTEQTVSFRTYSLDRSDGWSVFVLADPTDDESEGVVYACDQGKTRAVIVGIAKAKTASAADSVLAEGAPAGGRDLLALAELLQRSDDSGLLD